MSFAEDVKFDLIFSIPGYETNKRITLFGLKDSWFNQRGKADWAYSSKTKPCRMCQFQFNLKKNVIDLFFSTIA